MNYIRFLNELLFHNLAAYITELYFKGLFIKYVTAKVYTDQK